VTVLVDMDGVIADFDLGVNKRYKELYPDAELLDLSQDRKQFYMSENYEKKFGASAAERVKELTKMEGFFLDLEPMPGSIDALREMDKMSNVHVMLCTSPLNYYHYVLREKYAWVEKHLGAEWVKRIVIAKDKTVVHGHILIDDRPYVQGSHDPSWEHILFDQPYNRSVAKRRITSWCGGEWEELIKSLF